MADTRIDALSMQLQGQEGKDKLAEEYGKVIDNIATQTISGLHSNKDLSGDPTAGSVEAKRFANVKGNKYGTARSAGEASKVKALNVVVPIDDDLEYIEEIEEKDLKMYGVNGLIERRTANHQMVMGIDNDVKFFEVMKAEGIKFETTETEPNKILSKAIVALSKVKNDFVNGVPLQLIKVACSPDFYGEIRDYLDDTKNANIDTSIGEFGRFHGVDIFNTVNVPEETNFLVYIEGAVAQPKHPVISEPERIGLSKATSFGLFIDRGTKCVTPDLVLYN